MQYRFFTIHKHDAARETEELNRFLRAHRIIHLDKQFVLNGDASWWSICVEYSEQTASEPTSPTKTIKSKIDYKEVLDPEDFAVFSKLREKRK